MKGVDRSMPHILAELATNGILLKSDTRLPSVCTLAAGEPVQGSWWAHPKSHQIFRVLGTLASHPDVLLAKLISGKDTFVHRSLWPLFLAVAMGCEGWQFSTLNDDSRDLFARVENEGSISASGPDAAALEKALLVHSEQVHTAAGSHAKVLTSWSQWTERANAPLPDLQPDEARASFDNFVSYLNARYGCRATLPWQSFNKARRAS